MEKTKCSRLIFFPMVSVTVFISMNLCAKLVQLMYFIDICCPFIKDNSLNVSRRKQYAALVCQKQFDQS